MRTVCECGQPLVGGKCPTCDKVLAKPTARRIKQTAIEREKREDAAREDVLPSYNAVAHGAKRVVPGRRWTSTECWNVSKWPRRPKSKSA